MDERRRMEVTVRRRPVRKVIISKGNTTQSRIEGDRRRRDELSDGIMRKKDGKEWRKELIE